MEVFFLMKGILLGFSIAAPVGPIGVLCIRRTLAKGLLNGVLSGLGTATADAIYGCMAAFGLTIVSGFLLGYQIYLHIVGGAFLLYLGYKTFKARPSDTGAKVNGKGWFSAYSSAFFLTLTNPMTILSFAAMFAGVGLGATGNTGTAVVFVSGVFVGSMIWWLLLSGAVSMFRSHLDFHRLRYVNRLSGVVITIFGIVSFCAII